MPKKISFEEFAKRIEEKYNGKFSIVSFKSTKERITCKCNACNYIWNPYAEKLLYSIQKCPKCDKKEVWKNRKDKTTFERIVKRIKNIFPSYDLSLIPKDICTQNEKITAICPVHGKFETTADSLLHKHGCKKCQYDKLRDKLSTKKGKLIEESKAIHNNFYDYSKVENDGFSSLNTIICPNHGEFMQDFEHHLRRKQGCPYCSKSHLETEIRTYMENNCIDFIQGHKNSIFGNMHIDFYLPKYNIAIECQGEQHYLPIKFFGGDEKFALQVKNDIRKRKICEENGIKLFYFTHFKNKVDNKFTFSDLNLLFNMIGAKTNEIKPI